MRWRVVIILSAVIYATLAEPEPKKYKPETKDKLASTELTDEERKFLREVEAKFGVKPDVQVDEDAEKTENEEKTVKKLDLSEKEGEGVPPPKPSFPAVIAIEIVNDTETTAKGKKRTIDANLGYGYRTNSGYSYTYFGKPAQDKGKFMIYPYSQQDIPPANPSSNKKTASIVEIQPSQAYELVPVKDEQSSYEYKKPSVEFGSKYQSYENNEQPAQYQDSYTPQTGSSPSTLYTVYNGEQFSGLQGQFPKVMSNYFVEPNQLLQNPQYKNVGLTQDHLRSHGPQLEQRVVPVLVLRIPSSYLKNPSAELYANLPQNYPLSRHLNNVNLQELVNQYFKKLGYPSAPRIMSYQDNAAPEQTHSSPPVSSYEPQYYANPHIRPSYTNSDYSGIQYSAVQPVMAKYPTQSYHKQQLYTSQAQPLYQQPLQPQNYEYQYQYMNPPTKAQNYYVQKMYHQLQHQEIPQQYIQSLREQSQPQYQYQNSYTSQETVPQEQRNTLENVFETSHNQQYSSEEAQEEPNTSAEYGTPQAPQAPQEPQQEYESPKLSYNKYEVPSDTQYDYQQQSQSSEPADGKVSIPETYGPPKPISTHFTKEITHTQSYEGNQQSPKAIQQETITIYPSAYPSQSIQKYIIRPNSGSIQTYLYQKQVNADSASKSLVISENYPSKDHTHALPLRFKDAKKENPEPVQAVSYVTPTPNNAAKYQSEYKVMVPQTVLKNNEQVTYVNSHSLPMHYMRASDPEYSQETEYSGGQSPAPFSRNYHNQKRMATKTETKSVITKIPKKEQTVKHEEKKSS